MVPQFIHFLFFIANVNSPFLGYWLLVKKLFKMSPWSCIFYLTVIQKKNKRVIDKLIIYILIGKISLGEVLHVPKD